MRAASPRTWHLPWALSDAPIKGNWGWQGTPGGGNSKNKGNHCGPKTGSCFPDRNSIPIPTHLILKHPCEVDKAGMIISILQIRKPKCTEVIYISPGFTAQMQQSLDSNSDLNFLDPPKAEKLRWDQIAKGLKLKAQEVTISSVVSGSHRGLRAGLEDPLGSWEQKKPEQKEAGCRWMKEEHMAVPQRQLHPTWATSQRRKENTGAREGIRLQSCWRQERGSKNHCSCASKELALIPPKVSWDLASVTAMV